MNFSGQRCDQCDRVKGEANGWWLIDKNQIGMFVLRPWDKDLATTERYYHICSENCAAKALSQFMSKS